MNKGSELVERMNAAVGTNEFKNGSGRFVIKKKTKITMYVSNRIIMRRVQLVSQAFPASARRLRSLRSFISWWSCFMVGIGN